MKRNRILLLCLLAVSCLLLCACGNTAAAPEAGGTSGAPAGSAPANPVESTPEPTPEPLQFPDGSIHDPAEIELDLSALTEDEVDALLPLLAQMPELRKVDLGTAFPVREKTQEELDQEVDEAKKKAPYGYLPEDFADSIEPLATEDLADTAETPRLSMAAVKKLQDACPQADFDYRFRLFTRNLSTLDEELNFSHIPMDDEGEAVKAILPCMTHCKSLDMDFCGVSSPAMAEIRDAYPDVDVVWRVWFGLDCSVRTDVERILASNLNHRLTDDNTFEMRYCTKVKYLDIGHNDLLHDFTFLEYMPDLEVAIIALTGLQDLNYLHNCHKLEYLEINTCRMGMDLSPLANCKSLEHLNICWLGKVKGYEALCELTNLKRLWIGMFTTIPEEGLQQIREALPNTVIDTKEGTGCGGTWRHMTGGYTPRYALLRQQFDYDHYQDVCATYWNDPLYGPGGMPY
ncbi:MAG: hypothetical protein J5927_01630 [Oscillospiraceae bacterium]|nr:hypothetical protein [Oscillospiraceae bacterium]